MSAHVPSSDMLLGYAAGTLPAAVALAVAAHAALNPATRAALGRLDAAGGALLNDLAAEPLRPDALDRALAGIDAAAPAPAAPLTVTAETRALVPVPLWPLVGGDIGGLPWRKRGKSVFTAAVDSPTPGFVLRFLRIEGGHGVPVHTHRGTELTLVLRGAYIDRGSRYARGDLQYADAEIEHRPIAEAGETCLCFAVLDAPIRFTSALGRLANPFVRL